MKNSNESIDNRKGIITQTNHYSLFGSENKSKNSNDLFKIPNSKTIMPPYKQNEFKFNIKREVENKVLTLIKSNKQIIVIKGEEGMGKTILGLQLKDKLLDNYIVYFFKSESWQKSQTISKLIFQRNIENFESSIMQKSKSIIIFLDGVNEKNALNTSIQILESYSNQSEEVKKKITLVFTTRDLSLYADYEVYDWNNYQTFELKRFTDNELKIAINKLDANYDFEDFPQSLKSVASIPRYLYLVFQLKDKFDGYENITKEMLYFEGLKEQIKKDPKMRDLNIVEDSDIESILYDLVHSVKIINGKVTINQDDFKSIFGSSYRSIKTPFQENRMSIKQEINKIELNFDMVVIAYSLYLLTLFEEIDTTLSIEEIADFFKEKLEPYDNDNMTNIPLIVFQLSLEKDQNLEPEAL